MSSTLSLRIACSLALATSLAACQTNQINPNHPDYQIIQQKVAPPTDDKSSALAMDMSGRHEYKLTNGLKIVVKEDHLSLIHIWRCRRRG